MENFNEDLDREEFVDSAVSLLDKLDINSRNIVLNYGKQLPKSLQSLQNELFKPKISKKSEELANNQKHNFNLNKKSLEDRLIIHAELKQRKIEVLKQQQIQEEMKDCTFRPATTNY
tara:strand:- start:204 stop:554 length:351 start_codon:yes stop_codon:yes gene_type:complete